MAHLCTPGCGHFVAENGIKFQTGILQYIYMASPHNNLYGLKCRCVVYRGMNQSVTRTKNIKCCGHCTKGAPLQRQHRWDRYVQSTQQYDDSYNYLY